MEAGSRQGDHVLENTHTQQGQPDTGHSRAVIGVVNKSSNGRGIHTEGQPDNSLAVIGVVRVALFYLAKESSQTHLRDLMPANIC